MSELEQLLSALKKQTQAMNDLTGVVYELVQSNQTLIAALAGDDEDVADIPAVYLDGKNVQT